MPANAVASALERVYAARFFRRHPVLTPALRSLIEDVLAHRSPRLPVFMLWGVHEKGSADALDDQTMDHLSALLDRMHIVLSSEPAMTIVLCDSHAAVNCIDSDRAEAYMTAVESRAQARGWTTLRLSSLWQAGGLHASDVDTLAPTLCVGRDAPRLLEFASKHYRGAGAAAGAARYMAARLLERPLLAQRFAGSIHLTPSEPSLDPLQPELPTFNIWTWRKGRSGKPWFTKEPA